MPPSTIWQRDVISPCPIMKVISQSKGISGEPWLLQRPGKLRPVTLFMCEVRQTALSRRQLAWLMIPPPPPASQPPNILSMCPADIFLSCRFQKKGQKHQTISVNGCHPADVRTATRSLQITWVAKLFSSTCIYSQVQTEILCTVNARALLSAHVCEQVFTISARICVTL